MSASHKPAPANGGTPFPPSSRPPNDASLDMGVPPRSRRLYGRSGRAALTAGTLTPVGDNVTGENVQRNVEVRDSDGYDPDDVAHTVNYGDNPHRTWTSGVNRAAIRKAFQEAEARRKREVTPYDFTEEEALRQSRLRRWQTPR